MCVIACIYQSVCKCLYIICKFIEYCCRHFYVYIIRYIYIYFYEHICLTVPFFLPFPSARFCCIVVCPGCLQPLQGIWTLETRKCIVYSGTGPANGRQESLCKCVPPWRHSHQFGQTCAYLSLRPPQGILSIKQRPVRIFFAPK